MLQSRICKFNTGFLLLHVGSEFGCMNVGGAG